MATIRFNPLNKNCLGNIQIKNIHPFFIFISYIELFDQTYIKNSQESDLIGGFLNCIIEYYYNILQKKYTDFEQRI